MNHKFMTTKQMSSIRFVFKEPIIPLTDEPGIPLDARDEGADAADVGDPSLPEIVVDKITDGLMLDDSSPAENIKDSISTVRREWMELIMAPVLLHRAGIPIPVSGTCSLALSKLNRIPIAAYRQQLHLRCM